MPRIRAGDNSPRRRDEVLDAIARRSRDDIVARAGRLRIAAPTIVQSALAAALAWFVATNLIGHEVPFFAPIAALISLGGGLGQRLPRAFELVIGVAVGVLIGDLLISVIGTGSWQILVVVLLAMVTAVLVGAGGLLLTQAGASAVLVATLVPAGDQTVTIDRFVDALVGGAVGIGVAALLLPLNPVVAARRQVDPLLRRLADVLEESAAALESNDREAASLLLVRARETQIDVDRMNDALEGADEIARISPARWRKRGQLTAYLDAATPVDYLARNTRVMIRHVIGMLRRSEPMPDALPAALRATAGSLRLLRTELERNADPTESRQTAVAAADMATEALDETGGFSGQVVVAQVRSMAVDVLMATGLTREEAGALLPGLPEGPVRYG